MAYQVLARKWRPKKFADLVGQEHVVKALANALDKGRLHHAYLLTGTRGVGKTTIARILAKSLNCPQAVAGEPCGVCDSCTQIDAGRYVDLLEIDAASNTGIDNIREVLENAQYAPTLGRYKVYIIDEVHMLSKSAFNAMLKTLEEPPEHVKFILATTDPHKVPVTVLSRCLQFVLRNLNAQQVRAHLAHVLQSEGIAYEDAALQLLGRAAMGSMRDALSLLDQAIAMGAGRVTEADVRQMIGAVDHSHLYDLLAALAAADGQALMAQAEYMAGRAVGFGNALGELALLLQRLALLQTVPGAIAAADPEYGRLQALAQAFSGEQIQLYYQCAIRGQHDLTLAPDEYAGFVMTLLRMLAFTPLAAAAHPPQGRIVGSQLQDAAPPDRQPASSSLAPVAAEADGTGEGLPENPPPVTDIAAVPDTVAMPAPESAPELVPVSSSAEDAAVAETAALAEAVLAEPAPLADVLPPDENPDADDVPPWLPLPAAPAPESPATADVTAAAAREGQTDDGRTPPPSAPAEMAAEVQNPPPSVSAPLPPLNADNWPQIVAALAPKLGAIQMFAQHSAVAAFDAEAGLLTLALAAEGEVTADKARLQRLGEVLSSSYATPIRVQTRAWQAESGLETQMMRRQRLQQEAREQARQCLEADAAAAAIRHTFDAEWLPESLVLLGETASGAA